MEYIYILHASINRVDEENFDPNETGEVSEIDAVIDSVVDFLAGRGYEFNATYKIGHDNYVGKE